MKATLCHWNTPLARSKYTDQRIGIDTSLSVIKLNTRLEADF